MTNEEIQKWATRHGIDRFPSELRAMISDAQSLAEQPAPVLSAGPITPEMANWSDADKAKLTSALTQHMVPQPAQQEPVAQRFRVLGVGGHEYWTNDRPMSNCTILEVQDLYTFPQPAQRKPLTDEQFLELLLKTGSTELVSWATFVGGSIQMQGKIGLLRGAKLLKAFLEAHYGITGENK